MAHLRIIKGGEVMGMGLADYVWLDPEGHIFFKKKSILIGKNDKGEPEPILERWTFLDDPGPEPRPDHTLVLVPCFYLPDPTRPQPNYIVICELRDQDDHCVEHNERAKLREALDHRGKQVNLIWFGFEQNYLFQEASGGEEAGFPARCFDTAERHIGACFDSGILFHSAWNPPSGDVWDFKIGYRAFPQDLDPDPPNALVVADHVVVARYLMGKIGGSKGIIPLWHDLSIFISTAALRELGGDEKAEATRIENALQGKGGLRRVPHPVRGGVQCIELDCSEPSNPYTLAHTALTAVWPQTVIEIKQEK